MMNNIAFKEKIYVSSFLKEKENFVHSIQKERNGFLKKGIVFGHKYRNGKLIESFCRKNLIVNTSMKLIALLFSQPNTVGPSHMAGGTGDSRFIYNEQSPANSIFPEATVEDEQLFGELDRVTLDLPLPFINPDTLERTIEITNIVECSAVFPEGRLTTDFFVELGIFGGPNADKRNGGLMINHLVWKPPLEKAENELIRLAVWFELL